MKNLPLYLLLFLFSWGCVSTSIPPASTRNFSLEEDEQRLWLRSEEEQKVLKRSGLILADEELTSYLNEVARKLQGPDGASPLAFRIFVLRNPLLNAFAFPNGEIYVHMGILCQMDSEAQLSALLGHEMTHSLNRHTLKQFRNIKNKTAFLAAFRAVFPIGSVGALLGAVGTMAAVTGYSQELETEADREGFKRMVKAGYDPGEALALFHHLKREAEEGKKKEPFFFGTHPRIQERIENYEKFIREEKLPKGTGLRNQEIFQARIKKIMLENAVLDLKAGRFRNARKGVEKHIALKPDDPRGHYLLGEIHRQGGEEGGLAKAKECFQKAASLDPDYADSYKGLGLIYYKQGEKARAKDLFEKYLSLSPRSPDRPYVLEYLKDCAGGPS